MRFGYAFAGVALIVGAAAGLLGNQALEAQDPLTSGTILQRTVLGSGEMEAILVLRELPAGGESGRHAQSGNEIVYILEGSVILEIEGQPAQTVEAGSAFTTGPGVVHNVKNASDTGAGKALAFYVAKAGAELEDLAVPEE